MIRTARTSFGRASATTAVKMPLSGELYVLDVERETFTHLAHFADDHVVRYLFGIALSAAEDFVIGAPLLYAPGAMEAGPEHP